MKAQVEPVSSVKIKINVELEPAEYKKEEAGAIRRINNSVTVPGFRKGKVPESTIRKIFFDRMRQEALSAAIDKSYVQVLKDMDIWPVDDPKITLEKFEDDGAVSYFAEVEVRPKVEAAGYSGLALKRETPAVTEDAVTERLEAIRNQCATFEPAGEDYAASAGDMAVVDFDGKIDGEPIENGSMKGHTLLLGSGRMIPGFEEGVVGAKAGEERTITVNFPERYHAEHLQGKPAEFSVRVTELKRRVVPELCDDFAKTAANVESLDELKAKVSESLMGEQNNRVDRDFRGNVIDMLLKANVFEVPSSLVKKQKEHTIERMRYDLSSRGIDPASWGIESAEFLAQAEKTAERTVRWAFLSDAIAKAESVDVSDEEVDERIKMIAEADGRPYAQIRGFFEQQGNIDSLKNSMREQKALDKVIELATVEDVSADEWNAWKVQE